MRMWNYLKLSWKSTTYVGSPSRPTPWQRPACRAEGLCEGRGPTLPCYSPLWTPFPPPISKNTFHNTLHTFRWECNSRNSSYLRKKRRGLGSPSTWLYSHPRGGAIGHGRFMAG